MSLRVDLLEFERLCRSISGSDHIIRYSPKNGHWRVNFVSGWRLSGDRKGRNSKLITGVTLQDVIESSVKWLTSILEKSQ